jgi:hypothetical protein
MAIITSAAIAGTAITASTIASGVGLAAAVGSAGASFRNVKKFQNQQAEANDAAMKSLAEAKKTMNVNYYEQLGIETGAYEMASRQAKSTAADLTRAAQQGEGRGVGAAAGQIYAAGLGGQEQVRASMAEDLMGLDKLVAAEDSRIAGALAGIDLQAAEGAQLAARDAQQAAAASTAQGFQSLQSGAQQLYEAAPLFDKSQGMKQYDKLKGLASSSDYGLSQEQFQNALAEFGKGNSDFGQLAGVGYTALGVDAAGKPIQGLMTSPAFQDYIATQGKQFGKSLYDPFSQFLKDKYKK